MKTPLHAQKVAILSRLIKESSLTSEEALLLLKPEEEEETYVPQQTIEGSVFVPYTSGTNITSATNLYWTTTTTSGSISVTNNSTSNADL